MPNDTALAWLLVFIGAAFIATGCVRPIHTATVSTNIAAAALVKARAVAIDHRAKAQRAAARRVKGDPADASVLAEKLDRIERVGATYRPFWDAYDLAYQSWLVAVKAVKAAKAADAAGVPPDLTTLADIIRRLAELQQTMEALLAEATSEPES